MQESRNPGGVGLSELSFSSGDLLERPWVFYYLIQPGLAAVRQDPIKPVFEYRFLAGMKRIDVEFGHHPVKKTAATNELGRNLLLDERSPMTAIDKVTYDKFDKILKKAEKLLLNPDPKWKPDRLGRSYNIADWVVGFDIFGDEDGLPFFPFFQPGKQEQPL